MSESTVSGEPPLQVGDRVWLLLPPAGPLPRRGPRKRRHDGTVVGIDDLAGSTGKPIAGVRIDLDQPARTLSCYATHSEVHPIESAP